MRLISIVLAFLLPLLCLAADFEPSGLGFRDVRLGMDRAMLGRAMAGGSWQVDSDKPDRFSPLGVQTNDLKVESVSVEFADGKVSRIVVAGPVCVYAQVPGNLRQWLAFAVEEAGGRPVLAATLTAEDFQDGKANEPLFTRKAKSEMVSVELVYEPPGKSGKNARYSGRIVYTARKKAGR